MNKGDGTFLPKVDYHVVGAGVSSVFCADLDTFPGLDLATTLQYNNGIEILTNNGDGTFKPDSIYDVLDYPYSVFCADLDGDGHLDLAVGYDYVESNNVSILKNNGDGTFQPRVDYGVGSKPNSVFCADLDGDGHLDLAVGYEYVESNNVSILKNNGDGTFRPKVDYNVGNVPTSVFCADLDGDLDLDLAVANRESNNVSILRNLTNNSPRLLFPIEADSVKTPVTFDWQKSILTVPSDTVRYDLYLSRSIVFHPDSTIVYDSLSDTSCTRDSLDVKNWYWKVKAYDQLGVTRLSDQTWSFYVYVCGDCNGDGKMTVSDVVYGINYLFKGGFAPKPAISGNVNCDDKYNISDVVYLINYLFKGGPKPCQDCP